MNYQHKKLAEGGWFKLDFFEQLANIGSEVERAILWKNKNNKEYSKKAFFRALELLELSLADNKNKRFPRLKELTRLKETLIDFFYLDNRFSSSEEAFQKYFYAFAYATRHKKKRL